MTVTVGPYRDQDMAGIDALWREAFPDDLPRHRADVVIPAKLAFQPDLLLVACEEDRVIGSVMMGYDGHRGWIYRVAVLKSHRTHGVGALMMREAEDRLRSAERALKPRPGTFQRVPLGNAVSVPAVVV